VSGANNRIGCGVCDFPWSELPMFEVWVNDARWAVHVKVCVECGTHRYDCTRINGGGPGWRPLFGWARDQVDAIAAAAAEKYMRQRARSSAMRPGGPRLS
jgi:hypothetical protein